MENYDSKGELLRRLAEKLLEGDASRTDVISSGLKFKSGYYYGDVLRCGILRDGQMRGGDRLMVHHIMNNLREIVE